jgi:endonuclease/exonuclease/phosphatase (EEP) superfamily protein YafD
MGGGVRQLAILVMATKSGTLAPAPSLWRRLAKAVVVLVAVAVALIWLVLASSPEQHPALALLQYAPYPAYLLPALGALIASCLLGWRWRLLALASLGVVLVVLMGLCLGQADEGYSLVRLMSYNVKAFKAIALPDGPAKLAVEIIQNDPDVLLMQDAGQLMQLQQTQPAAFKAIVGQREVYNFGQYVVASRLPIKDCAPGWIPYRNLSHSFVHCVLTVQGKEVDLVTVHFTTPRDGLNATRFEGLKGLDAWSANLHDRLTQSGELAEHLRQMKRPRIVAGDLNAPEASVVVQTLLHTGMRDAFSAAGTGFGFTHGHSLWPHISFLRIDHILVSDQIGVREAYAGGQSASEHRPVIADLLMVRQ